MNANFETTYREVFRKYYSQLLFYATRMIGEEEAEDIVQDVFVDLWRRRESIEIGSQIKAFLYRAVYTHALNVLKHRDVKSNYEGLMLDVDLHRIAFYQPDNHEILKKIEDKELRKRIGSAISELPEKCRMVFKLSYLHHLKNKQIAETMDISLRTVEAHMYKALRHLRERLGCLDICALLFFMIYITSFFS
ncbi:MAG: RNA polymerase sigma-70 factor [Phocaeicola sp.]